jgi:hypothetical protein
MMSIGMHCRLLGRPGRIVALQKFLDHIEKHDRVWVCRRIDIARHWKQDPPLPGLTCNHDDHLDQLNAAVRRRGRPPARRPVRALALDRQAALAQRPFRSLAHLKHAMAHIVREPASTKQLALIRAHPELAGKAMVSKSSPANRPTSRARRA